MTAVGTRRHAAIAVIVVREVEIGQEQFTQRPRLLKGTVLGQHGLPLEIQLVENPLVLVAAFGRVVPAR
jgi:hypothetical protein